MVGESKDAHFIKCHCDEIMGFAFALKIPVLMSATVFDTLSVAGVISKVHGQTDTNDIDSNTD